ncbi:DoxX family membrane protein [Halosolutus gelatinilyticus]|uniref:DoxX family membrane protein n=1 Tax=Halosolutus gelatinilyticus TaxID=2931975 RepID=UPI001FF303D6|nr:DoxX family membrane protein [Halosolutus gelatinilyticus]
MENEPVFVETPLFRIGRALFGGVLALNALDNLRNLDERIGYAEAKNAPAPEFTVPATSGGLLFGGLGLALWRAPSAAAAATVGFLASITPVMHDFWNVEDPEQQQQEVIHFLKNTALLGAAIAFLKFGRRND